jgi:hypothetical protein
MEAMQAFLLGPLAQAGPQAAVRPWLAGAWTILDDKRLLRVLTELACEQPDR